MYPNTKNLSLLEQKRIQWVKEREEMVGLCGLWGHQKDPKQDKMNQIKEEKMDSQFRRNSLLPPIQNKNSTEEGIKEEYTCRPEEESETSGYLSDSPKHLTEKDMLQDFDQKSEIIPQQNEQLIQWCETGNNDYWAEKKMYKNFKNEKWAQQSTDSWMRQSSRNNHNKSSWYGTPDSVSSDDGSRLRWGDRGVGVGHLWDPVVHQPESRLPQVTESYRTTPKWVERGLNNKADILVIHHPGDENYKENQSQNQNQNQNQAHKNFLLGQNVPLPPEILEERERKRKKALEHQNAIRKQLEERENRRREEKENRIKEEKMEEERIRREQEIERLRYEEEQKKNKQKEEKEKRKEEAMKEALELAEKRAKEEKKNRKHVHIIEEEPIKFSESNLGKIPEKMERKRIPRTPKPRNLDEAHRNRKPSPKSKEPTPRVKDKNLRDSASQFEQIRPSNGVQFLNVNNLPMDGGLALVLDTPPTDNNLLLPSDVQLALLMSPGNVNHNQLIPLSAAIPNGAYAAGRILTPSKYRLSERSLISPRDKATQTDSHCCSAAVKKSRGRTKRSGRVSGYSDSSEKSNSLERPHAHQQCTLSSRYRSRSQPRLTIDERPKWGINRPTIQYKKQSEKDPYYQKKLRQRLKKTSEASTLTDTLQKDAKPVEEKLLESDIRLLKCDSEEDEENEQELKTATESERADNKDSGYTSNSNSNQNHDKNDSSNSNNYQQNSNLKDNDNNNSNINNKRDDFILRNGYRMNSNPASPMFVPIGDTVVSTKKDEKPVNVGINLDLDKKQINVDINDHDIFKASFESDLLKLENLNIECCGDDDDEDEDDDDDTVVPGSVGFLTQKQLDAIQKISTLRQGLENLKKDMANSRSVTPYSDSEKQIQ